MRLASSQALNHTKCGRATKPGQAHQHLRGPYVFCQADGQPHTNGTMKGPLERALREADICREQGRIGWHDLRHTYGATSRCVACRSRRSRS
jgi:hypothetical protein